MYHGEDFSRCLQFVKDFRRQIGIEVFPLFHDPAFEPALESSLEELRGLDISFHEPYYGAEHSAPEGSEAYIRTADMCRTTLRYARALKSRYMVFHHNNCRVTEANKKVMRENAKVNYRIISQLYAAAGIKIPVENVGVADRGNVLFDQQEFTELCRKEQYPVLIDIGHAHANSWDLEKLMRDLKTQIIAYHIHNNDGIHDSHRRIHDGSIDFEKFLAVRKSIAGELGNHTDLVLEYAYDVAADEEGIAADLEYVLKNA